MSRPKTWPWLVPFVLTPCDPPAAAGYCETVCWSCDLEPSTCWSCGMWQNVLFVMNVWGWWGKVGVVVGEGILNLVANRQREHLRISPSFTGCSTKASHSPDMATAEETAALGAIRPSIDSSISDEVVLK